MNEQLAFSFDLNLCTGCLACVVACQDQNDWKADQTVFRTVAGYEKGPYPATVACLSIACMHCADAPCIMVCPTGALFRHAQNGVVDVNQDLCVGCRSCTLACPFGAPKFTSQGKMAKCDLCHVRVAHGLQPACVHTCTTGALTFGPSHDLDEVKTKKAAGTILKAVMME